MTAISALEEHLQTKQLATYIQHLGDAAILEQWYQQQQQQWQQFIQTDITQQLQGAQQALTAIISDVLSDTPWHALVPADILQGTFLRPEVVQRMLEQQPPPQLLQYLGYASIQECLQQESVFEIMAALRFAESAEWMNQFLELYQHLTAQDFEERPVQFIELDTTKWWKLAEPFVQKKKHHFSHLKELGIIFNFQSSSISVSRIETTMLLLHYLYEVKFYANWFTQAMPTVPEFGKVFVKILQGDHDVPEYNDAFLPIVQQYHFKTTHPLPVAFQPHVMSEALHYRNVELTLFNLLEQHPRYEEIAFWKHSHNIGGIIDGKLYTVNFSDTILSQTQYFTYHYIEDLWNTIFELYHPQQSLADIMIENFHKKYITLKQYT